MLNLHPRSKRLSTSLQNPAHLGYSPVEVGGSASCICIFLLDPSFSPPRLEYHPQNWELVGCRAGNLQLFYLVSRSLLCVISRLPAIESPDSRPIAVKENLALRNSPSDGSNNDRGNLNTRARRGLHSHLMLDSCCTACGPKLLGCFHTKRWRRESCICCGSTRLTE